MGTYYGSVNGKAVTDTSYLVNVEHVVTRTTWHVHRSAACSCGLKWRNTSYDGGAGNRNTTNMIQHLRDNGGLFAPS